MDWRRMGWSFLAGMLALSWFASRPAPGLACSCASNVVPPTDIVFVGRALAVLDGEWIRWRLHQRIQGAGGSTVALVAVELTWQGPERPFYFVVGGTGQGDCRLHFVPGATYLIQARHDGYGPLDTNTCGGSRQKDVAIP